MDKKEKYNFCNNIFDVKKCNNIKNSELCLIYIKKQYKKCIKIFTNTK
jgi:hypothetical protein